VTKVIPNDGQRGEARDDEFLARKAKGLAAAYANRIVVDLDKWTDLPRLDELDPDEAAQVERVLDGA
jgi:hypothetical protein